MTSLSSARYSNFRDIKMNLQSTPFALSPVSNLLLQPIWDVNEVSIPIAPLQISVHYSNCKTISFNNTNCTAYIISFLL